MRCRSTSWSTRPGSASSTPSRALYRVKDSIDFVGAARSALACGFDPTIETYKRRLVLPLKVNSCEEPPGQGFVISDIGLEWDKQPISVDVEEMLAPPIRSTEKVNKTEQAKRVLKALLAGGESQYSKTCLAVTAVLDIGESTTTKA